MRTALAVALSVVASAPAYATDWTMYNAGKDVCVPAIVSGFPNPQSFKDSARQAGNFDGIRIIRDGGGNISVVAITLILDSGQKTTVWYFGSMNACQRMKSVMEQSGEGATQDELR